MTISVLQQTKQSPQNHKINLNALCIEEEDGSWTAVGMKHYIVAQGDSADEAVSNLARLLVAQYVYDYLEGRKPLADFSEAPSDYQKRFEDAHEEFKPPIPKVDVSGSLQGLSGDLGFSVCDCKIERKS